LSIVTRIKKDDQILIVFGTSIPDTTGHQVTVRSNLTPRLSLHYLEKEQAKYALKWTKMSINFISPDL